MQDAELFFVLHTVRVSLKVLWNYTRREILDHGIASKHSPINTIKNLVQNYLKRRNNFECNLTLIFTKEKYSWSNKKDAYQSLHDVFIELFGEDHLVVADTSLNNAVLQLESFDNMTQHGIPMLKWLLTLLFAIENELVNTEDIKDVVMVIVSSHREGIVERADDISKTLGQDSLEELLYLIPISRMPLT